MIQKKNPERMEEVIKGKISGTAEPQGKKRRQYAFLREATKPLAARYIGSSRSFTGTGLPCFLAQISMKWHYWAACPSTKIRRDTFVKAPSPPVTDLGLCTLEWLPMGQRGGMVAKRESSCCKEEDMVQTSVVCPIKEIKQVTARKGSMDHLGRPNDLCK